LADEAWAIIKATPHLTYQILTKRPERIAGHLPADWGEGYPNVWLGTSVENQTYADARIPLLLAAPAKTKFLSCEPLLGSLDLHNYLACCSCCDAPINRMNGEWRFNGRGWEHKCPKNPLKQVILWLMPGLIG
jgi:hypothetical protein